MDTDGEMLPCRGAARVIGDGGVDSPVPGASAAPEIKTGGAGAVADGGRESPSDRSPAALSDDGRRRDVDGDAERMRKFAATSGATISSMCSRLVSREIPCWAASGVGAASLLGVGSSASAADASADERHGCGENQR